ncbi:ribbon-helix-helix protein, CopG family [Oscillospiraceae bacterium PP1C4]
MSENKLKISRKSPKGEDGYKTFSIRVKDKTLARIEELAAESGRSRNELIGIFLDYALNHCEIENT